MLERANLGNVAIAWTSERLDRAKWLWENEGFTSTQIAAELGGFAHCADGGRNAVIGVIHRNGWIRAGGPRVVRKIVDGLSRTQKAERQAARRSDADRALTQTIRNAQKRREKGPKPPQVIEETPQPTGFLGIAFMELEDSSCRFPRGEGAGITFCGQTALKEQPYCAACMPIAYQPPARRDNSPAPARFAAGPGAGLRAFRI